LIIEYQPKPEEMINIEGSEKETLFWHLKSWIISGKEDDLQKHLDELWLHYKDVKDQRLLALVGALCIETALDILLTKFMVDYESLKKDTDITFSLKIKIAKALKLIPLKILNSCHLVRQIRNEFAHNLSLSVFSQLQGKHLNSLGSYVREYNIKDRDWEDWEALYRDLIGFTSGGLVAYSYQLEVVKSYLDTDYFRKHLKDFVEEKKSKE
jgi:hypothetical protein